MFRMESPVESPVESRKGKRRRNAASDSESDEYEEEEQEVKDEEDPEQYPIESLDDEFDIDPLFTASFGNDDPGEISNEQEDEETINQQGECSKSSSRSTNFLLRVAVYKRRFVGETSGNKVSDNKIEGESVSAILDGLWKVVQPWLHREVVFVDDNGQQLPTWADNIPCFSDMGKFVYLQNHANRRRININQVDSKLLVLWQSKEIRVHVHVYSTAVSCKQLWDLVDKQLIRPQNSDRAGAPDNQSLTVLADQLRVLHGNHFTGHSSSWKLWANYVHSLPAHEQDRRMSDLPPHFLMKFFRSVPISEAVQLDNVRSGLSVANTINDAYATDLDELDREVDQLVDFGLRIKQRIKAMRARSSINTSLVSAMNDSVRPEENELSRSLAEKVSDMQDVDHQ